MTRRKMLQKGVHSILALLVLIFLYKAIFNGFASSMRFLPLIALFAFMSLIIFLESRQVE